MHIIIVLFLHILIFSSPAFIGALFTKEIQIYLNYTFLGLIFCLTQIFDSLYAIELSSNIFLNGGDISYCALIFIALFLVLSQPEPKVVRNLIYINFVMSVFLFCLFLFLTHYFESTLYLNYLNIPTTFLEFSYKSLLFSFFLFSSEILVQLFVIRKLGGKIKNRYMLSFLIALNFCIVLIIDGILYPIGINILFPGSHFSIRTGIIAKCIFGGGFGLLILLYLLFFPNKLTKFVETKYDFVHYLLPPKTRKLVEKLENAEKEISELRQILPICAKCKKIRDDEGYWSQLEEYFDHHGEVSFSHGLCPDCQKETMDELDSL